VDIPFNQTRQREAPQVYAGGNLAPAHSVISARAKTRRLRIPVIPVIPANAGIQRVPSGAKRRIL
jgi:hypothetical protein